MEKAIPLSDVNRKTTVTSSPIMAKKRALAITKNGAKVNEEAVAFFRFLELEEPILASKGVPKKRASGILIDKWKTFSPAERMSYHPSRRNTENVVGYSRNSQTKDATLGSTSSVQSGGFSCSIVQELATETDTKQVCSPTVLESTPKLFSSIATTDKGSPSKPPSPVSPPSLLPKFDVGLLRKELNWNPLEKNELDPYPEEADLSPTSTTPNISGPQSSSPDRRQPMSSSIVSETGSGSSHSLRLTNSASTKRLPPWARRLPLKPSKIEAIKSGRVTCSSVAAALGLASQPKKEFVVANVVASITKESPFVSRGLLSTRTSVATTTKEKSPVTLPSSVVSSSFSSAGDHPPLAESFKPVHSESTQIQLESGMPKRVECPLDSAPYWYSQSFCELTAVSSELCSLDPILPIEEGYHEYDAYALMRRGLL